MPNIEILIGVAGVGKSTYVKNNKTKSSLVLSSDELRKELFGSLEAGNTSEANKIVFSTMDKRLKDAINSNKYDTIYYDATNLNRKTRSNIFNVYHKKANIIAVVLLKPLAKIIEQNNQRTGFAKVPDEVIKRMYESLQVPRLNVDCHEIKVIGNYDDFKEELELVKSMKHDSPYHFENVDTHIQMTIENALRTPTSKFYTNDELVTLAKLHDLGKGITKKPSNSRNKAHDYFIEVNGSHSMFNNHANVGAFYALLKFKDELNESNLKIIEAIYQHMNAHNGFSEKMIKKYKLDNSLLSLANDFAKIDSNSRILDEKIYTRYIELLNKKD